MKTETHARTKPSPIAQLRSRGALCRADRRLNDLLAESAEIYADLWRSGEPNLPSLGLPRNTIVQSQHRDGLPHTIDAKKRFNQARAALASMPEWLIVLDRIALFEEGLAAVGREVSGFASEKQSEAIALDRLRCGLKRLAVHFGKIAGSECVAAPTVRDSPLRCWRAPIDPPAAPAAA